MGFTVGFRVQSVFHHVMPYNNFSVYWRTLGTVSLESLIGMVIIRMKWSLLLAQDTGMTQTRYTDKGTRATAKQCARAVKGKGLNWRWKRRLPVVSIQIHFDTSLLSWVVNSSTYLTWVRLETTSIETTGFQNGEWDRGGTRKIRFFSLSLSRHKRKKKKTQEKTTTVLHSKLKYSEEIMISWRLHGILAESFSLPMT